MSKKVIKLIEKHHEYERQLKRLNRRIQNFNRIDPNHLQLRYRWLYPEEKTFQKQSRKLSLKIKRLKQKISEASFHYYNKNKQNPNKTRETLAHFIHATDFHNKSAKKELSNAICQAKSDTLYLDFLDLNSEDELFRLGLKHLLGIGGEKSIHSATFALEKAASKGSHRAEKLLKKILLYNESLPPFQKMSYRLYQELRNINSRQVDALKYFVIALKLDNDKARAKLNHAMISFDSKASPFLPPHNLSAKKLFRISVDLLIGITREKHFYNALLCLQLSAKKEYKPAVNLLKRIHRANGWSKSPASICYKRFQALRYQPGKEKEAINSFIQAYYLNESDIRKDIKHFAKQISHQELLCYPSEDKSDETLFQEGVAYLIGIGVKQNTSNAVKALIEAVKNEHTPSLRLLNKIIEYNTQVPIDDKTAAKLSELENCHLSKSSHYLFFKKESEGDKNDINAIVNGKKSFKIKL